MSFVGSRQHSIIAHRAVRPSNYKKAKIDKTIRLTEHCKEVKACLRYYHVRKAYMIVRIVKKSWLVSSYITDIEIDIRQRQKRPTL